MPCLMDSSTTQLARSDFALAFDPEARALRCPGEVVFGDAGVVVFGGAVVMEGGGEGAREGR